MQADPETVVEAYYTARLQGDIECALAYCTEDVEVKVHSLVEPLGFGGRSRGRAELQARLRQIDEIWNCIQLSVDFHALAPPMLRGMVNFKGEHRPSGAVFDGRMRTMWTMRDGRIALLEQFMDDALLKSFLDAAGQSVRQTDGSPWQRGFLMPDLSHA